MPKSAHLIIHGNGGVEVELVIAYLSDLKLAYESILVFESMISGAQRASREFPFRWYPAAFDLAWSAAPRRAIRHARSWPPTSEEISSLIPRSSQLVVARVQLSSPGFWDVLGKLNPLEVIRQYLNDRHERRKDRDYRESAEKRQLTLENMKRENEVIAGRIKIARELGATDDDLAPLLNEFVYKPLTALDRHQDRGVIEHTEISRE
jgi:hypothetical protein